MKRIAALALGMTAFSAGTAASAQMVETGYPTGSLAVAAIERGDWSSAERLLSQDRGVETDDPARLLNLGRVYMATGRTNEALATWREALADPHPAEVTTMGGRVTTTDQLAREALDHYERTTTIAAR
ncbi:MAG: tetratricopeptide repeat protein [Allosphingosinicella sp.]